MEDQETRARAKIKIWLEKNHLVVRRIMCLVAVIFLFCLMFTDDLLSNAFIMAFGTLLLGAASILGIIFGPQKIQDTQVEIQRKKQESELEIQRRRGESDLEIERRRHNAELEIERRRHNAELEIQRGKQDSRLNFERQRHARDHQFSVAKKSMVLFGSVRPAFSIIRNPFITSHERAESEEYYLSKIKDRESTKEELKKTMSNNEILLLINWRIHKESEFFKKINKLQPEFLAVFKTQKPFTDLWAVIHEIRVSARALGSYDRKDAGSEWFKEKEEVVFISDEEFFSDLDDQGEPTAGAGPTTFRINKIVRKVVRICSPVLEVSDDK